MKEQRQKVELLSPASGLEAIQAAVFAGADAVYTGGSRFGARAYADNLAEEELLQAIDFVHLYGRRLYLTVNTLLKEDELAQGLEAYLMPYYRQGLDAVIVQDIGVFSYIRTHFPDLPIHISTQATVTGANSAAWFEKMGASRIVTARELSLEELRKIRRNTSLEIESFVHGALCYCYSGQCFFSSFIGGRSGNRGRCAQPCRLPYSLSDNKGRRMNEADEQYLLSPKDMCALEILPDVIEAGVDSLKIEGRMKSLEYMAGVTEIYRKYVDLYYQCGKESYRVCQEDRERLMDLFNRGSFHSGYYTMHNGKDMMSPERPNHQGVYAGRIRRDKKGWRMKAQTDLHQGDVLELHGVTDQRSGKNVELTLSGAVRQSDWYVLPGKYTFLLEKCESAEVYRIRNEQLLKDLHSRYAERNMQIPLSALLQVKPHLPLSLTVRGSVSVTVQGDMVEPAQRQPADEAYLRRQIGKTGNTEFLFCDIQIRMEERCFVPAGSLNQLRREALELYRQAAVECYHREDGRGRGHAAADGGRRLQENGGSVGCRLPGNGESSSCTLPGTGESAPCRLPEDDGSAPGRWKCHVLLEQLEHLQLLLQYEQVDSIYISMHAFSVNERDGEDVCRLVQSAKEQCRNAGKQMYLAFPYIWRKEVEDRYLEMLDDISGKTSYKTSVLDEILACADGVLARSLESFVLLMKQSRCVDGNMPVYLDYNVYTMNREAAEVWQAAGASGITLPLELNQKELLRLAERIKLPKELIIYGHMPMMVSAQCPLKNHSGCEKKTQVMRLRDRKGSRHYVRNYCDTCYSVIYNSQPLCYLDWKEELSKLSFDAVRLQFSVETEEEIRHIMGLYIQNFYEKERMFDMLNSYTRGHWKRGVE